MRNISSHHSFRDILRCLAQQDPEEKLRIAFKLNNFVKKIYKAGIKYEKTQRLRAGTTA